LGGVRRRKLGTSAVGRLGQLRLRAAFDHAGANALFDDLLVVLAFALELPLDAFDHLGLDGAHMVFHFGKTERLKHGDHVFVGQPEIPSDLVYANFVH